MQFIILSLMTILLQLVILAGALALFTIIIYIRILHNEVQCHVFTGWALPVSTERRSSLSYISRVADFLEDIQIVHELLSGRDGRDGPAGRDGLPGPAGAPGKDGHDGTSG